MGSHPEAFVHEPNDSDLQHFYQRNFIDYPHYTYKGLTRGGFKVRPEDAKGVFGPKHIFTHNLLTLAANHAAEATINKDAIR